MIETRVLTEAEFDATDAVLPLHRFDGWSDDSTYLVAWDGPHPVGHVHIAWAGTELRLPELQDMYVLPERRGAGIGAALAATAERLVAERGHSRCSLSVSARNDRARRLYERLGYTPADQPPQHVRGTITIRGEPVEVDDVIVYLTKPVVDLAAGRSS